jgi:glutathione S-transferase
MSTPKLHLYLLKTACSMAPHILLQESGVEFDKTMYDKDALLKIGGYPAEYLEINPKGKVPALKVDDEVITENLAIFTVISQLFPEKNFLGKTPMQTVRAYEWLSYLGSQVHAQGYGT